MICKFDKKHHYNIDNNINCDYVCEWCDYLNETNKILILLERIEFLEEENKKQNE